MILTARYYYSIKIRSAPLRALAVPPGGCPAQGGSSRAVLAVHRHSLRRSRYLAAAPAQRAECSCPPPPRAAGLAALRGAGHSAQCRSAAPCAGRAGAAVLR